MNRESIAQSKFGKAYGELNDFQKYLVDDELSNAPVPARVTSGGR